jgi:TP901 family phage tail tape measure protein
MAKETEIDRLVVRLVGDSRLYIASLKKAGTATTTFVKRASAQIKALGVNMKALGRSLTFRLTAPLMIFGGLAVRQFATFDKAMVESTSIMKVTEKQIKSMSDQAINLSKEGTLLQSPKELAEAYFFLASANKDAEQSMALLPKIAAFATAGTFDMALATDLLTDAQSALGMSSKDVVQDTKNLVAISDILVKANTLANASVQQFAESLTADAATASREFGMELKTTMALLALYADKGKKAAESGNLLGRATRLLSKSARENAKVFDEMGIRVIDEISGEYRNFIDILEDMNVAFEDLTGPQRKAALAQLGFAALAQKSILPLLGATEQLKQYEKELDNAMGTTMGVALKQMKSFSAQIKVLKNNVEILAIEIGKTLAPFVIKLSNLIKRAIGIWDNATESVKRIILIAAAAAAAIGPILLVFGSLISLTSSLTVAIAGLGIAVTTLSVPILLTVAALGLLTGALAGIAGFEIAENIEGIKKGFSSLSETVTRFFRNFNANSASITNFVKGIIKNINFVIADLSRKLIFILKGLKENFLIAMRNIGTIISTRFEIVFKFMKDAATAFFTWYINRWKNVATQTSQIMFDIMLQEIQIAKMEMKLALGKDLDLEADVDILPSFDGKIGGVDFPTLVSKEVDDAMKAIELGKDAFSGILGGVKSLLPSGAVEGEKLKSELEGVLGDGISVPVHLTQGVVAGNAKQTAIDIANQNRLSPQMAVVEKQIKKADEDTGLFKRMTTALEDTVDLLQDIFEKPSLDLEPVGLN